MQEIQFLEFMGGAKLISSLRCTCSISISVRVVQLVCSTKVGLGFTVSGQTYAHVHNACSAVNMGLTKRKTVKPRHCWAKYSTLSYKASFVGGGGG